MSQSSMVINSIGTILRKRYGRLGLTLLLLFLISGGADFAFQTSGVIQEVTLAPLMDAYLQVSVFVAVTLLIFFSLEKYLHIDVGQVMQEGQMWQVPIATILGLLPGCGGAIVVITSFARGKVTLGAMVGALIGTMGDAAFLLLTQEPTTYVRVILISAVAGILTGWAVDKYHPGELYTVAKVKTLNVIGEIRRRDIIYIVLAAPGLILGILGLMQVDIYGFGAPVLIVGIGGVVMSMLIWSVSPVQAITLPGDHPVTRTAEETSFVTIWVVVAFLLYEYSYAFFGLDLAVMAQAAWLYIPLLAVLIGFIPGCGPQILVTTLYLQGIVPFAGLIGNAIANDGDALFPAIALTPRMAIIATLYSGIPALIISYYFLFFT